VVDAIMARPTIARLILRYVADAEERPAQRIYSSSERLLRTYLALFEKGRASGELTPLDDNPFHAASAVIGTTVFYVSALASLIPFGDFEPLAPRQVAAHKRDVLSTVQRLLGISDRPRKASQCCASGQDRIPPAGHASRGSLNRRVTTDSHARHRHARV
jgi:hypothetical protein